MAGLDFYRGDTLTYNFTFKDSAGVAIDISNTKLYFTLKTDPSYPDTSASLQDSITFPADADSIAGIGSIVISAASTNTLALVVHYYDFQWINGTVVTTMGSGTLTVLQDITRTPT